MKKTLKILMAIILFAVVIMLATSVNAATLGDLVAKEAEEKAKDENYVEKIIQTRGTTNEYTLKADLEVDETIEMSNNQVLTLEASKKITVTGNKPAINVTGNATIEGAGTITNTASSKSNVVVVNSGAKLVVDGATIAAAGADSKAVEVAGTLEFLAGTIATAKVTNNNAIVFVKTGATAPTFTGMATLDTNWTTDAAKAMAGSFKDKDNKAVAGKVYGLATAVDLRVNTPVTIEVGHVTTLKPTATLGGYDLDVAAPTLNSDDDTTATNLATVVGTVLTGVKKGTVVATYKVGEVTKTVTINVVKEGETAPNPDDNNGDDNQGDNNEGDNNEGDNNQGDNNEENKGDANQNEDKKEENNNDLDDTPKTGDHIIPATALLAVVVVANVVYFAKMKRN